MASNEVIEERLKSLEKEMSQMNSNFRDYKGTFVSKSEYNQFKETIRAELDPLKRLVWGATMASLGGFVSALYALITRGGA